MSDCGEERVTIVDEQVDSSSRERMVLPLHLQVMAAAASKITIVSDNAKAPPLSPWSPLFREERGLPPLGGGDSKNSSSDGSRRKSESRWDSMPQPKRLSDDNIAPFPSLARIRQCGYIQGHDIGYGIPLPATDDDPTSPNPTNSNDGESNNNNHDHNNDEKPERGLNLPRRRGSFEVSREFTSKDSVSLLSQVLSAFDLSDEEDEDGDTFMLPPPPPPPGRFSSPPPPVARQPLGDSRPALSPDQSPAKVGSGALSIPVRRASIDSVDFLLSEEDLEGFFTDEDDTEHGEIVQEFQESDDEEEDEDETEFYDDTENGEDSSSSDVDDSEGSFRNHSKDDSTLVTATTATTSTTLSSLRSSDARDMPRR